MAAATSLAEERARGSLDLLLCTPLSTWQIVMGKWLGVFRGVVFLAILPCIVIASISFNRDEFTFIGTALMLIYVLCAGSAVTSLGILMATWIARPGRALGATIACYVLITAGVPFLAMSHPGGAVEVPLALASPFYWAGDTTFELAFDDNPGLSRLTAFWTVAALIAGCVLLDRACCDFDRRLGRVEGVFARVGRASRRARAVGLAYFLATAVVALFVAGLNWDVVAAAMFAGGLIVSAGIAASSTSNAVIDRGEASRPDSLSAAEAIALKWVGAFRYAAGLLVLPFLMICAGMGLDLTLWREHLMVVLYMIAATAAVTSLGIAAVAWLPVRYRAVVSAGSRVPRGARSFLIAGVAAGGRVGRRGSLDEQPDPGDGIA